MTYRRGPLRGKARTALCALAALAACSAALPVLSAPAAAAEPGSGPQLTCGYPVFASPPPDVSWTETGTDAAATVGISSKIGSVGVDLGLTNTHAADQRAPVDIVDAENAAGSGWQTSYWLEDARTDRLWVFNQAAGNFVGYQWGYSDSYDGTAATEWDPLWSDHYHPGGSFENPGVGTTPCAGSGMEADNGRMSLTLAQAPGPDGQAVLVRNDYQLQSLGSQTWEAWALEQALYLSKQVAEWGNLRVYLHGHDESGVAWSYGPISPFQSSWSIPGARGGCSAYGCDWQVTGLDYAVFVYDIFGEDVAVAQLDSGDFVWGLDMNNTQPGTLCADPGSPSCGDIEVHDYETYQTGASFSPGQVRDYPVTYLVGTPEQLTRLGYGP